MRVHNPEDDLWCSGIEGQGEVVGEVHLGWEATPLEEVLLMFLQGVAISKRLLKEDRQGDIMVLDKDIQCAVLYNAVQKSLGESGKV